MHKVSTLTIVFILLSLIVVRESLKSSLAQSFGCQYGRNIFLTDNFYTSSSLVCSSYNYYTLTFSLFLSLILLSFLFKLLGDIRTFSYIFCFSFVLLIMDIIFHYHTSINYSFFLLFLPFMFFSVCFSRNL